MAATVKYPHIGLNAAGTAVIKGTRIKVRLLATVHLAYKWDAEQIQAQYPDLTLGQIHGALAYYYDHKTQIDREIRERQARADEFFDQQPDSPLHRRLRQLKRQRSSRE